MAHGLFEDENGTSDGFPVRFVGEGYTCEHIHHFLDSDEHLQSEHFRSVEAFTDLSNRLPCRFEGSYPDFHDACSKSMLHK
jgi:hypothetical protein